MFRLLSPHAFLVSWANSFSKHSLPSGSFFGHLPEALAFDASLLSIPGSPVKHQGLLWPLQPNILQQALLLLALPLLRLGLLSLVK